KYSPNSFGNGTTVRHRDDLDAVQREFRAERGLTVLIYDQTCAAEKRRRRKRGQLPELPRRVFINDAVCEGCGDCTEQSDWLSVKAARDRVRAQANDRPVQLQPGFFLPQGFLPELRFGARRQRSQDRAAAGVGCRRSLYRPASPARGIARQTIL